MHLIVLQSVFVLPSRGSVHALIWVAALLILVQMTFALLLSQALEDTAHEEVAINHSLSSF